MRAAVYHGGGRRVAIEDVRVIVNGKTIVADGQLTRERPGRVLKIGTAPS